MSAVAGARDALLVDTEVAEGLDVLLEGERGGTSGGGAVVLGVDLIFEIVGAEGEQGLLHGPEAVETPGAVGDGLDQLALHGGLGLEVVEEVAAEFVVGDAVFGGDDDGLAGETVAQGVEAGTLLAFGGARAGGMVSHILLILSVAKIAWPARILAFERKEFRGFSESGGGKMLKLMEKIYLRAQ